MDSKEIVNKLFSELGDPDGKDPVEYMKRASELYYSNEDKIGLPSYFASPMESCSDNEDLVQYMKETAEHFFNQEAFLPTSFFSDDSEKFIQSDSDISTRMDMLRKAEDIVMSDISPAVETFDITIMEDVTIHTVCFKTRFQSDKTPKVPLVMIHGFGGCIPTFHKNYGQLAKDRCVYGIDLPGFALSSRVKFPNDATKCENKMVDLIERWRIKMNLEKIILLGHSFGGYISAAYSIKYSSHVHHLVLVDPWGVLSQKDDNNYKRRRTFEELLKKFFRMIKANPTKALQMLGPTLGTLFVKMLLEKSSKDDYGHICICYFILAITTGDMTGAKAFSVLSDYTFVYPKSPLKKRLIKLLKSVPLPITFIYGGDSPYMNDGGKDIMMASKSVIVRQIEGGSHHIHAQKPDVVVKFILESVSTDHIQVQKKDDIPKIVSDFDSLSSPLPVAKKECALKKRNCAMNTGEGTNKRDVEHVDKLDNFARYIFILLLFLLIAIVFSVYM